MPSYKTGDLVAPSSAAYPIVPSDTVANTAFKRLYVGGAGNINVLTLNGANCTFTAVPVGTTLEIRGTRVNVTGTTATNIVGLV